VALHLSGWGMKLSPGVTNLGPGNRGLCGKAPEKDLAGLSFQKFMRTATEVWLIPS